MNKKYFFGFVGLIAAFTLVSCHGGSSTDEKTSYEDICTVDTADTMMTTEEEQMLEEVTRSGHVDELFDDFLYTFTHIRAMQKARVEYPMEDILADGRHEKVERGELNESFDFLDGEFTTTFWNNRKQTAMKEDTTLTRASVEKLDLVGQQIVAYDFHKKNGKWMLFARRHSKFSDADMPDFLQFYSKFSSDSTFRQQSLSESIRVNMLDPDDENQSITGTIDPQQFPVMCPDVPGGEITNIRYGQRYDSPRRVILEKSGQSNGMSEIFTFEKEGNEWKLTEYDN